MLTICSVAFIDRSQNCEFVPGNIGIGLIGRDCRKVDQVRGEEMRV